MTNEEAIKVMQLARAEIEWEYPLDYVVALDTSILALEKQIPKKPHKSKSEYYCPSCPDITCVGKNHRDGHRTRHDFCLSCGQAIDWRDDNDK